MRVRLEAGRDRYEKKGGAYCLKLLNRGGWHHVRWLEWHRRWLMVVLCRGRMCEFSDLRTRFMKGLTGSFNCHQLLLDVWFNLCDAGYFEQGLRNVFGATFTMHGHCEESLKSQILWLALFLSEAKASPRKSHGLNLAV